MTLLFILSGFIHSYAEKVLIDYVYYEIDETTKTAKVVGLEISRKQSNGCYYSSSSYHIQAEITHENHQYKITDISSLTCSIPLNWYTTSIFYAVTKTITIGEGILHISDSAFKNATFHPRNYTQPKSIFSDTEPLNITLPNSLQSIGNEAFEGIKFNQLTLPDHLVSIGDNAFKDCRINNTSFSIPNSVASIGEGAFMNCVDIKDLTISNSLTTIPANAFAGCVNVEGVTVPRSVESIGNYAFAGCTMMHTLSLPSWLTTIGDGAFSACNNLAGLTIPERVSSLGANAFADCSSIKTVTLPESLKTIGAGAFMNCTTVGSLILPPDLTLIAENTFSGCTSLQSVTIAPKVTAIGEKAFYGCGQLSAIDLPSCLSTIGVETFRGCNTLESLMIPDAVVSTGRSAFADCSGLKTAIIGNGLESLAQETFRNCSALQSLTIGEKVAEIGSLCFDGCNNLMQITSLNTTPPTSSSNSFAEAAYDNATLIVPGNSEDAYRNANVWKYFRSHNPIPVPVTSVTLDKTEAELSIGQSITLHATILPEDATDKSLNWKSSDENVATVDAEGNVTAIGIGKASVTASCGNLSATCAVTVSPVPATSLTLDKTALALNIGQTVRLMAEVLPENATDKSLNWKSSDENVATVDAEGNVVAVGIGKASVTASCGNLSATCIVTVSPVPATSLTLDKTEARLNIGHAIKLTAEVLPENATDKTVTWLSSDENVATVDAEGNVTAIAFGETEITASCGTISASCRIHVNQLYVTDIIPSQNKIDLKIGESVNISVNVLPVNATEKTVVWSNHDSGVATVSQEGLITAVSAGNTKISIAATDGSDCNAIIEVSVTAPSLEDCHVVWDQSFRCAVGDKVELTATSSMEQYKVSYRGSVNGSGYHMVEISEENGKWYASFPEAGPCYIDAYIPGIKETNIRNTFNVVSEHDGLLHIDGLYYRYTDDTRTALKVVAGYDKYVGDYTIPAHVNGLSVKAIDRQAFYTCPNLGSITISNGVESIGHESFGNSTLSSIDIPESVAAFDTYIFNNDQDNIRHIYLHHITPPRVDSNLFNATDAFENCILHVPAKTIQAYKEDETWKNFRQISDDVENPYIVSSITVDKQEVTLLPDEVVTVSANVSPSTALDKDLAWMSLDPNVATVDNSGNITAIACGETRIHVKATDGSDVYTEIRVTVKNPVELIWDQTFRCSAGDKVLLSASSSEPEYPVSYKCIRPDGGFRDFAITEENGLWYASFTEAGPCIIEASVDGFPEVSARKTFNVVTDADGLMLIDGLYYRYTDDTRSALMVVPGYELYEGDYVIPAMVGNLPVKEIGKQAFYSCTNLGKVSIEDGIEILRYEAFGNCTLTSIDLPSSVTRIDNFTFNALEPTLTDIYLHRMTPLTVDHTIFNATDVYTRTMLHVPAGTLTSYGNAEVWKEFVNIVDDQPRESSITDIPVDNDGKYTVHNMSGVLIMQDADIEDLGRIKPGIYIINGKKILIK